MPLESKWAQAASELPPQPSSDSSKHMQKLIEELDEPKEANNKPVTEKKSKNEKRHQFTKDTESKETNSTLSQARKSSIDKDKVGLGGSKWATIASSEDPQPHSTGKNQFKAKETNNLDKKKVERANSKEKDSQRSKRPTKTTTTTTDIADSIRAFQIDRPEKKQPSKPKSNRSSAHMRRTAQPSVDTAAVNQPTSSWNNKQAKADTEPSPKSFTKWEDLYDFNNETSWADDDDYDYSR